MDALLPMNCSNLIKLMIEKSQDMIYKAPGFLNVLKEGKQLFAEVKQIPTECPLLG